MLEHFELDKLTIYNGIEQWWGEDRPIESYFKEDGQCWEQRTADSNQFRGVPKGLLESLLRRSTLDLSELVRSLAAHR
jgi:hypothetical protein